MICCICLKETGCTSVACAICQRCGAGVCLEHLVEMRSQPATGPGGSMNPTITWSMVCWRCYDGTPRPHRTSCQETTESGQREQKQGTLLSRLVYRCKKVWSRSRPQSPLPEPEEAIMAAELFLKQQRSP